MTESRSGWVTFAGVMLFMVGVLNIIYGIGAIDNSTFFVNDSKFILGDLNTWGWVTLIIGIVQGIAASQGIAYGQVFLYIQSDVEIPSYQVDADKRIEEISRFEHALLLDDHAADLVDRPAGDDHPVLHAPSAAAAALLPLGAGDVALDQAAHRFLDGMFGKPAHLADERAQPVDILVERLERMSAGLLHGCSDQP